MNLDQPRKYIHLTLFIPPLLWIIYRLYSVDITHDEAWSFHMAYKELTEAMWRTANNHWLNTFSIFIQTKLLGTDIWKIRIHSLLAFFLLASYLHKICMRIPNAWFGYLGIILITYNTYTLDFFSLARGYALGLGFSMAAIYYILYQAEGAKNRLRIYCLLCLAALSVYTELYILLAYGLYELLFVFKLQIFTKKKFIDYIKPLWILILFLTFAIQHILFIKKCGDLNEGQSNGFFQDTLGVFIERAFEPWFFSHTATVIGIILFAILLLCFLIPKLFETNSANKKLAIILLLLFGLHQFLFYVMGTPYSFGRTALYYIIPLLLCVSLILGSIKYPSYLRLAPVFLFLILFAGHLLYATQIKNIHTTQEWWMGQGVSQAIDKIARTEKRNLDSLSILFYEGHNGDYNNYYVLLPEKKIIKNTSRIHLFHLDEDFKNINQNPNTFDYILLPDYDSLLNSSIQFNQYDSLSYYPNMKTWLLRKKF